MSKLSLRGAGIAMLVAAAAAAAPAVASADRLPLDDDIAPIPRETPRLSARSILGAPLNGPGFTTLSAWADGARFRNQQGYVVRLVHGPEGDVEAMRAAAEAAAAQVRAISGVQVHVAAGTIGDSVPDREPQPDEIILSVDSSTPCGAGMAGCGGPRIIQYPHSSSTAPNGAELIRGGRVWIYPVVLGYSAADKTHVVAHELGHALGLGHHDDLYEGQRQVMHSSAYDADGFRSGDANGLRALRPGSNGSDIIGIRASDATIQVGHSTGSSFWGSSSWGTTTWPAAQVKYADVTGDGRADVVRRNPTTYEVSVRYSTGAGFGTTRSWGTWGNGNEPWHLADVNGDGRADLIGRIPSNEQIQVGLSTGETFLQSSAWTTTNWAYTEIKFADVDGDLRADLVARNPSTYDVQVARSTGYSFLPSTGWQTWGNGTEPWHLADVTGDGRADIIGRLPSNNEVHVGRSTGATFMASTPWTTWIGSFAEQLKFADVNGDNRADIVGRNPATLQMGVGLSSGTAFQQASVWQTWGNGTEPWMLADVDR